MLRRWLKKKQNVVDHIREIFNRPDWKVVVYAAGNMEYWHEDGITFTITDQKGPITEVAVKVYFRSERWYTVAMDIPHGTIENIVSRAKITSSIYGMNKSEDLVTMIETQYPFIVPMADDICVDASTRRVFPSKDYFIHSEWRKISICCKTMEQWREISTQVNDKTPSPGLKDFQEREQLQRDLVTYRNELAAFKEAERVMVNELARLRLLIATERNTAAREGIDVEPPAGEKYLQVSRFSVE